MDIKIINGIKCIEENKAISMNTNYSVKSLTGNDIKAIANIPIGFNINDNKEYTVLQGYANNKLIPGTDQPAVDSYGDVPTGDNIYKLDRMISNPVMLAGHNNEAHSIMGNFIYLNENEQGLQFISVLRPLDEVYEPKTKDAISAWSTGFGKALSIGGRWYYDFEKSKPDEGIYILIEAELREISGVAIGADKYALVQNITNISGKESKGAQTLEEAIERVLQEETEANIKEVEKFLNEREKLNVKK